MAAFVRDRTLDERRTLLCIFGRCHAWLDGAIGEALAEAPRDLDPRLLFALLLFHRDGSPRRSVAVQFLARRLLKDRQNSLSVRNQGSWEADTGLVRTLGRLVRQPNVSDDDRRLLLTLLSDVNSTVTRRDWTEMRHPGGRWHHNPLAGLFGDGEAVGPVDEDGPTDATPARPRRSTSGARSRPLAVRRLAGLLGVLLVGGAAVGVWVQRKIDPAGAPGPAVAVEVTTGQSTSDVGGALERAGVITSASVWVWYVRLRGGAEVHAGTYELHENMSMGAVLDALASGPSPPQPRQVPVDGGLTTRELVSRLTSGEAAVEGFTAEGLQAALADPGMRSEIVPADETNIEGTLFPETYDIADGATESDLVELMVEQFDVVATELDLVGGAERLGYSPYEVLIVASLVEEEARYPEEQAKIARVIYNRLGRNEALGIDATSCYGQSEGPCRVGDGSPYDTRERVGLPPTPISSPGRASIEAALHPADGDRLYYVRNDGDGHHLFTASYDDFLAAEQECADSGWGCG